MLTTILGNKKEKQALKFLKKQKLKLLEKNFRGKMGEIDLIMKDNDILVFVEVRYRKSNKFGSGLETVNYSKQQKIIKTANYYLAKNHITNLFCRFDVISINDDSENPITWVKNAFGG